MTIAQTLKYEVATLKGYLQLMKQMKRKGEKDINPERQINEVEKLLVPLKKELSVVSRLEDLFDQKKDLRILARKVGYGSIFELQADILTIKKQFKPKQIKKEYPLVYRFLKKYRENAIFSGGPQPPTLGRYPATSDAPKARAIAGWKTFQQLPVNEIIDVDYPPIPRPDEMKVMDILNHLVYFTSKWSRKHGPAANLGDPKTLITANCDVSYIHRWRQNQLHVLKHPTMEVYYLNGCCKVMDVGIDDSDNENPAPPNDFDYTVPEYVFEIGRLVELKIGDEIKHFDSDTIRVCSDGEGLRQRLFLLPGKKS